MVSIINLASVADVETVAGAVVNPLRFRGNVYVAGWPPSHEFDLLGRELAVGTARLKVVTRLQRCAATNVDPDTGIRDLTIPRTLLRASATAIAASMPRQWRAASSPSATASPAHDQTAGSCAGR